MPNVRFNYLYRDGSNYHKWAAVVFSGSGTACEPLAKELTKAFLEDGLFIAHQVRIPEVFLWQESSIDADDHCFHEFSGLEETGDVPNDKYARSVREFVDEVLARSRLGWKAFLPADRRT